MNEKKLKIAVNCRMLIHERLDGTGTFAYQILQRMCAAHPEVEFFFFFDRPYSPEFIFGSNVTPIVLWPPTRHPLLTYYWFQRSVARALRRLQPDVFVSPDGILSLGARTKQIGVIHDINFFHHPQDLPWAYRTFFNAFFPRYARAADTLVTVSEYSKADIAQAYSINPNSISVIYNGVTARGGTLTEAEKSRVHEITDGKPYFIFIGSLSPRKNIASLLLAFDAFKQQTNSNLKLILVGAQFWGEESLRTTLRSMQHANDVVFTGRVSDAVLGSLLSSALALTYVPYFEGFGIPLVEAMAAGVPIIASHVTSLPEVAGDAALYVDPHTTDEIKNAMVTMYQGENVRADLIHKGLLRVPKFSWDTAAKQLWQVLAQTIAK